MTKKTYKGELFSTAQGKPKRRAYTKHERGILRLEGYGTEIAHSFAQLYENAFKMYAETAVRCKVKNLFGRVSRIIFLIAQDANVLSKWLLEGKWNPKPIEKPEITLEDKTVLEARYDLTIAISRLQREVYDLLLEIRIELLRQCDDPSEEALDKEKIGKLAEMLSESAAEWSAKFAAYAEALERETK